MAVMDTKTSIAKAVELLGGPVKAASALNAGRYQKVQQWIKNGSVPAKYCPRIERLIGGAVRCEELSPDVDWASIRNSGRYGIV